MKNFHFIFVENVRQYSILDVKSTFHLATLFARCEAKTTIRHRDLLKLTGEKFRREQVGAVPTFSSVRAEQVVKWKTSFRPQHFGQCATQTSVLGPIKHHCAK